MSILPVPLYRRIKEHAKTVRPFTGSNGIYVSLSPTAYCLQTLLGWATELLPTSDLTPEEFHCTVTYSKVTPRLGVCKADPRMDYLARLNRFEFWDGHDNDGYVVAVLDSPSLIHLHKKWKARGAVHSFPDYTPHVTLLSKCSDSAELQRAIPGLTAKYKGTALSFTRETLENLKA